MSNAVPFTKTFAPLSSIFWKSGGIQKITSRNIAAGCLYNLEEDKKSIINIIVYKNPLIIHIF
jgi:hypothetical protein